MALQWKRAAAEDLPQLCETRLMVLRAANLLSEDAPLPQVEAATRAYYAERLASGAHTALLVLDGDRVVGAGDVSYYAVMPTVHNPDGRKAYIMNMYTSPEYRRQGVARETLRRLVEDCHRRGVRHITLEATAAGRPLYERFGFVPMGDEMILPEE